MRAVLEFADAEQLTIDALNGALVPPVSSKAPSTTAGVRVLRTGGTRTKVTDRAQLTIEAYDPIESRASRLALDARAVVHSLQGTVVAGWEVYRVEEIGGPANLPDPRTNLSRYSQTQIVHVRIHEEPS